MKLLPSAVWAGVLFALIAAGTWTLTAGEKAASTDVEPLPVSEVCLDAGMTEAAKGGKPKPTSCCDPRLQPGACGNPFCFEGASCCSDGVWRCNQANGSPVCSLGKACDPGPGTCEEPCGGKGDSCSTGDDCCSGTCGKNGRCR